MSPEAPARQARDLLAVLTEFPGPATGWLSSGPEHARCRELGGPEAEWLAFRADTVRDGEAHARVREQAAAEAACPARDGEGPTHSVPVFDGAAHRMAVAEWFHLGRHLERQRCSQHVGNPRPFSPWPSFDARLRGDYRYVAGERFVRGDLDGKWGRHCCSWTEEAGCRWYNRPTRCSLATRQVVRPWCHGLDFDEAGLRWAFDQAADRQVTCTDPEGFVRYGLDCPGCPHDRLFALEPDPSCLEEVS